MKSFQYFALLAIISLFIFSCNSEFDDMGLNIQPEGDRITVETSSFPLTTKNLFIDSIHHRPDLDSLLLGTFFDARYGATHADILARFEAPFSGGIDRFRFPENAEPDSAFLILSYRTWFGSPNSVMSIRAYEKNVDKEDGKRRFLSFYEPYFTNTSQWNFVDRSNPVLIGDTVLATSDPSQIIRIRLSDDFKERLFGITKNFSDEINFFEQFSGMYITSQLGDATMLHLRTVSMALFYHYKETVAGRDTTFVNSINYVVNQVVINRFEHPDRDEVRRRLEKDNTINHVSSPANVFTQVNIPLHNMVKQMQDVIGDKRLVVNSAVVRVEAIIDTDGNNYSVPIPQTMLLLPENQIDNFFKQERLPTDSIVLASFNRVDSTYTFNIASYIDREIRRVRQGTTSELNFNELTDTMRMVLVPVRVTTTTGMTGTTVSSVRQQVLMNGVTIRSGNDPNRPMKINLLYSGF